MTNLIIFVAWKSIYKTRGCSQKNKKNGGQQFHHIILVSGVSFRHF